MDVRTIDQFAQFMRYSKDRRYVGYQLREAKRRQTLTNICIMSGIDPSLYLQYNDHPDIKLSYIGERKRQETPSRNSATCTMSTFAIANSNMHNDKTECVRKIQSWYRYHLQKKRKKDVHGKRSRLFVQKYKITNSQQIALTALLQGFIVRNIMKQRKTETLCSQIRDTLKLLLDMESNSNSASELQFVNQLQQHLKTSRRALIACFQPKRRTIQFRNARVSVINTQQRNSRFLKKSVFKVESALISEHIKSKTKPQIELIRKRKVKKNSVVKKETQHEFQKKADNKTLSIEYKMKQSGGFSPGLRRGMHQLEKEMASLQDEISAYVT